MLRDKVNAGEGRYHTVIKKYQYSLVLRLEVCGTGIDYCFFFSSSVMVVPLPDELREVWSFDVSPPPSVGRDLSTGYKNRWYK